MDSRLLLAIGMAGVIASSACLNTGRIDIRAEDNEVLHPGAKVEWKLIPSDDPASQGIFDSGEGREEVSKRRPVRPTLSVDLEYVAAVDGEDDANLSASQLVDYDGRDFAGPQRLRYDLTLHLGSASVRGGVRFIDMFTLEALAGVSVSALDLEIRGAGVSEQDLGVGIGPKTGARFTFTPHPVVDLYGQWQLHLLEVVGTDGRDDVVLRSWEAGARLHLTGHLSLFGGWREWDYDENVDNESDIDLELSGPTFGALLRF